MKGLYKRGEVWWYRFTLNGRQQFESMRTGDESLAISRATALLKNPQLLGSRPWENEVDAYLRDRVKAKRLSQNAAASRRGVLCKAAIAMGITEPAQVTTEGVSDWYRELQGRIEEVTAQTYIGWLSTFLSHLVKIRKLRLNPVSVEFDRLVKAKRKPFCTREQVRKIMDAAEDDEMRFVLYCGFHAGLRRGEIAEARPEWFDLDEGLLHVQRSDTWEPKDRDDRTIPLTKDFAAFLKSYGFPSPFMLPARELKRARRWRYRYDFRAPFEATVKRANLQWVTPHTMRRTFASLLVSSGVSLYKVAIWLGDLERVVQDHYGSLIPKDDDIERGTPGAKTQVRNTAIDSLA